MEAFDKHLRANKSEHDGQSHSQILKFLHHSGQQKVKRTKSENGEDVGSVNNESVGSDRKYRRNRINCKDQIGDFNNHEDKQQQSSRQFAIDPRKEMFPFVVAGDRYVARNCAHHGILVRLNVAVFLPKHLDAGVNQKSAEDIKNPMKAVDEGAAYEDHRQTHHECADHTPVENSVLHHRRHFEERKYQKEDEEVINRQRELNYIAGEKLQAEIAALIPEDDTREYHCQRDPNGAPDRCFAIFDCVGVAVEETEIQAQHEKDEEGETDPECC